MPRSQAEFKLACFVADTLRLACSPDVDWSHFPAGEHRTAVTGARLQRMGTARGWPDYIFIMPDGQAAFLELKSLDGRLSAEQASFKARMEARGCRYAVCATARMVLMVLNSWGILKKQVRIAA